MRNNQYNIKILIITGIILLLIISVVVINAQDMKTISRVKVSNQSIVISQGDTPLNNRDFGVQNSGNLNNQGVNGRNTGVNIENNGNWNNVNGTFTNNGSLNNQSTNINNSGSYSGKDGRYGNSGEFGNRNPKFKNQGGGFYDNGSQASNSETNYGTYNVGFSNKDFNINSNRYKYQNIDWSVWRSNFVNRILDDSMYITSLDNYGMGTWFYYSFFVTNKGEIRDVYVFSLYLDEDDKKAIRQLIRSYAHQPITVFPKDSKRKKAKVKAIMLLGKTENKSNASNFRDIEKIKIQY